MRKARKRCRRARLHNVQLKSPAAPDGEQKIRDFLSCLVATIPSATGIKTNQKSLADDDIIES